jgi:hypothetical protein
MTRADGLSSAKGRVQPRAACGDAPRGTLQRTDERAVIEERQEQEVNTEGSSSQPVRSGLLAGNGGARAGRGAVISVGPPRF